MPLRMGFQLVDRRIEDRNHGEAMGIFVALADQSVGPKIAERASGKTKNRQHVRASMERVRVKHCAVNFRQHDLGSLTTCTESDALPPLNSPQSDWK